MDFPNGCRGWACQRDRDRRGGFPPARGVLPAARHEPKDPSAARTPRFIPSVMRRSHCTPEGDQMPRAAALFARQLLLAVGERDGRSPREAAGTATRAPRT